MWKKLSLKTKSPTLFCKIAEMGITTQREIKEKHKRAQGGSHDTEKSYELC